jgi:hypothetical protein
MSLHKVLKVFYTSNDDKWPLKLPPFRLIPYLTNGIVTAPLVAPKLLA